MNNLENYGVLEMTYSEAQDIDGGIAPLLIYGGAWVAGFAIAYYYKQ